MLKVLMLEPNLYHQEILPGFIKYFRDLGCEVTLYTRINPKESKVFLSMEPDFKTVVYNYKNINNALLEANLKDYDFIFFSSLERGENKTLYSVLEDIKIPLNTKCGILGCYHTTTHVEEQNAWKLYNDGRIFFLNNFKFNGKKGKMLAPIYFGTVNKVHKKKQKYKIYSCREFLEIQA